MPSKKGYLLPNDWDGASYELWFMCIPCSPEWKGIIKGAVYEATREYNWEGTNVEKEVGSLTAWEVYDSMSNCNDGLLAIAAAIESLARVGGTNSVVCCNTPEQTGTELEAESADEPTVFGPGEQWPSEEVYLDDKCLVANRLWLDYRNVVEQLDNYNVDSLLAGGVGLAVGIVASILSAGVASVAIGAVLGSTTGIVTLLAATAGFGFTNLLASLDANKEDLVCALYNASDGTTAKANWYSELDDGLSAFEQGVAVLLNQMQFFNLLFEPTEEVLASPAPSPVDCSTCPGGVGLYFVEGLDGQPRGSGSLEFGTGPRTLTSHLDSNGFHYIAFQTDVEVQTVTHAGGCVRISNLGLCNDPLENWCFNLISIDTGIVNDKIGTKCDNCVHTVVFTTPTSILGIPQNVTFVEMIGNAAPFTVTVDLTTTPC